MGRFCEKGICAQSDLNKAIRWYMSSAKLGYPRAATRLGYFYQNGVGVEKDEQQITKWKSSDDISKLINAALSMHVSLGHCYKKSIRVSLNGRQIVSYYRAGSDKEDHPPSQLAFSHCYLNRFGVPKDKVKVDKVFSMSAQNKNTDAQSMLAYCYAEKIGTKKDMMSVIYWYHESAKKKQCSSLVLL
ncbi:MAG: hypothetical protein EXX96DRAFT_642926 [Benjaminiella poitrasii]|nr:MAG: hypothetical protein EXX96DRAFT_642926 [Benjaminiella poitrasii]